MASTWASKSRILLSLLLVLLVVVLTVPVHLPVGPIPVLGFLRPDHSWVIAQVELLRQQAQYGHDIVWTYGPLVMLSHSHWNPPDYLIPVVFCRVALAVAFTMGWWHLVCRASLPWIGRGLLLLGALILCINFNGEVAQAFWMSFAMLAVALRLQGEQDAPRGLVCLLALASSLAGLVKFTFLIWGCVAFGLMVVADILRRRWPIPSLVFAGGFLVGWAACGQAWSHLPEYFERHWAMTSGYSATLAKGFIEPFSERDVVQVLLAALLPAAGYLLTYPKTDRRTWMLGGAGLACFAWMADRYAFGGNQIWSAARFLGMMSLICLAIVSRHEVSLWRRVVARVLYVGGLIAAVSVMASYDPFFDLLRQSPWQVPMACLRTQASAAYQLAFAGRGQKDRVTFEQCQQRIVELAQLPPNIEGTADFLGNNPGVIPAQKKLRYTPRPTIESINSNSRRLAEDDAAFFRSERAPQHVLFEVAWSPGAPFDRLPATNDGPSWFELLSRYRLSHVGREMLLFSKRPAPRTLDRIPLPEQRARWNEEITLPKVPGSLLWAQIEIGDTTIGKLAELFYKRPRVFITVRTSAGKTQTHALVPRLATAGFLLSPHVAETSDMALVAAAVSSGNGVDDLERAESIRLSVEGDRGGFFGDEVKLKLARVPVDGAYPADVCPEASRLIVLNQLKLGTESAFFPPLVEYAPDKGNYILSAHAPSRSRLPVPTGGRRAIVSFGFRNTAWNIPGSETDGAEFRVTAVSKSGNRRVVADKVANPTKIEKDREESKLEFAIDGDTSSLVLETLAPSGANYFDHTYWSNVQFE